MIKLSDQLIHLKDKIGGKQFAQILVAPLEILSSMEESLVREKAIEALISLAEDQDQSKKSSKTFHLNSSFLIFFLFRFFLNTFFADYQTIGELG